VNVLCCENTNSYNDCKPSTQLEKTLEASLQALSMSSSGYPADVPIIVSFFPYTLQSILAHLMYHTCNALQQFKAVSSTGETHMISITKSLSLTSKGAQYAEQRSLGVVLTCPTHLPGHNVLR
jgi:hypothetical protein